MGWGQAERMRESPRKEYGKERGKQTGCKGSKKDHDKLWENNVWGGYIIRRSGEREKESPHTIIRQRPERPEMQNIGDGTEKEERKRGQKAVCKTKGRWLGRLAQEGSPDLGETHQIRCCIGMDGNR